MAKTVTDTFTHADTAGGTITSDQPWTVVAGTPRINANRLIASHNVSWTATMDTLMDSSDYGVEVDLLTGGVFGAASELYIMARWQDASNYYAFGLGPGAIRIWRFLNGSGTVLTGNITPGAAMGQRFKFEVFGSKLTGYIKTIGDPTYTQRVTITDSSIPAGKKTGLRVNGNSSDIFLDNFTVTDFPPHLVMSAPTSIAYEKTPSGTPKNGIIRITASENPGSDLVIPISVAGGSAVPGTDYTALAQSATIPSGQDHVDITVTPLVKAGVYSVDRTVRVTPSSVGGYEINPNPFAEVKIKTLEYDRFGGIVGASAVIDRWTNSDGKHTVNDPVAGPVGYWRTGKVGAQCVLVTPDGNAMYSRGVFGIGVASGSSPLQSAASARFGVANTQGSVAVPVINLLNSAMTRLRWNYIGGGGSTMTPSSPIPRLNNQLVGQSGSLLASQQPGSPDRKAGVIYNSGQLRTMLATFTTAAGGPGQSCKNIGDSLLPAAYTGIVGNAARCFVDAFDDPDVMPGAPGLYKMFCDGTGAVVDAGGHPGFIRNLNDYPTWETSPHGPEYAPYTTPWFIKADWVERDFQGAMANHHGSCGYYIAASAPIINSATVRDQGTRVYADPINWTKRRWKKYLEDKYVTIDALNTAWDVASYGFPNFYTTFDSAGAHGVGTGILDESGLRPWFGTPVPYNLTTGVGGRGVGMEDCQPNLRDDLDAMEELYWTQLIGKLYAGLRAAYPNVLMHVAAAAEQDSRPLLTKVCAQLVDLVGGDKETPHEYFYAPPVQFGPLTLSATTGAAVTVTTPAGAGATFRRPQGMCLIISGSGVGLITKWISGTSCVIEVLSPFASTSIAANAWSLRPPAEGTWMKYGVPNIAWVTVISSDSYFPVFGAGAGFPLPAPGQQANFAGSSFQNPAKYGLPPGGATTQALRAAAHKVIEDGRFSALTPDGVCPHMGFEWWEGCDKWAEGTNFGILSIDCKLYDGIERSQNGDFFTPVAEMNLARDFALLQSSLGLAPPAPVITSVLHDGDTSVSGTGLAGATVTVLKNGVSVGTTTVSGGGTWTKGSLTALVAGQSITAKQNNGIDSLLSNSVIVLAAVLAVPVISGTYRERDTVVTGTGVNGAVVTLLLDDGNQVITLGTTTVTGGAWSITSPQQLLEDDDLTATQTLGGQTSDPTAATTVLGPSPARIRVQMIQFIPGKRIVAVLRAVVPRAEMARYANPLARPIHPTTTNPIAIDSMRAGRVVEQRVVESARTILTQAAAQTLLEAKWTAFQNSITNSDTTGADGIEASDTVWDGTAWS